MVKREQISGSQLTFILIPLITATEFMSVTGMIYQHAKEDAWISYLLSSVTGIWCILVFTTLSLRNPGMTIIEFSEKILGKWLGKVLGFVYMYYLFLYVVSVSDELMSFITVFAQPHTPRIITSFLFLFTCAVGVWLGIEVIGRCSEFLVPIGLSFFIILSVFLIPEMRPQYLTPVFAHGMYSIVQGAVLPSGWSGEFFILGFLLPYLNAPQKGRSFSFVALGVTMLLMMVVVLETIVVTGPMTGQLKYAYYSAVRYISIGDFLERIDPVIMGVWVYNGFIKTAVFLWAFVVSAAQVFNLDNYRILIAPLMLLSLVGTLWTFSSAFELHDFLTFTFPSAGLVFHDIIPTLLLIIDIIRSRKQGAYEQVPA